jgi:hypothetical protein
MRIPLIVVKDRTNGDEHIVGTDVHDRLHLSQGGLAYENSQNSEGTDFGGNYEFEQLCTDEYDEETEVRLVSPGQYIDELFALQKERIKELEIQLVDLEFRHIPRKPYNGTFCPSCKRHLRCPTTKNTYTGKVKNRAGDNYCPKCGQAIDWGENFTHKKASGSLVKCVLDCTKCERICQCDRNE